MTASNADLRQFILSAFDDEGFETFCFDYFPDVHNNVTRGMTRNEKVRLLITHCRQQGRVPDLLANLKRERLATFPRSLEADEVAAAPAVGARVRDPRQVFISHAHADAALARQLADDLEAEGYAVWIAPDSIRPGEKWAEAIDRGLDTSGLFVLLLTPDAVASRWVKTETNVAIELEHEGVLRFVPVMVAACRLPALWRAYQRVAWRGGYAAGYGRLLAALAGEMVSDAPPEEAPAAQPSTAGRAAQAVDPPDDIWINPVDGKEFVRVPAGDFLAGGDKKSMYLEEFWISKAPVTNADYAKFVAARGVDPPEHWKGGTPPADKLHHPVVNVSWFDAQAYAEWAGAALPTEWQWEKAARGRDGRDYPWGNAPPDRKRCNFGINEGGTTPVGNYSPQGDSPYGCVDMSGNVWEWTASRYDEKRQSVRVLRGGSWYVSQYDARVSGRGSNHPNNRNNGSGFRVVRAVAHLNVP